MPAASADCDKVVQHLTRDPEAGLDLLEPGEHVQDRIQEQGALVWRLLAGGGYVYLCGSLAVRHAVREAFADVAAEHGPLPRGRAGACLLELERTTR